MPFLPPSYRFPPAGGGNPKAVVPLAKQGEPNGGGLQKVSCNEACRGNLKEGVRNFAYFRTHSLLF
jgi:hypothetical protein